MLSGNRGHFLNLGKMENVLDGGFTNSDFELNVKKKTVRFKAGAELSSSVNKMDVDVIEDITDTHETLQITIAMKSEKCPKKEEV
jgi:hypoxanthine-guanine phosphoribosyltransferase